MQFLLKIIPSIWIIHKIRTYYTYYITFQNTKYYISSLNTTEYYTSMDKKTGVHNTCQNFSSWGNKKKNTLLSNSNSSDASRHYNVLQSVCCWGASPNTSLPLIYIYRTTSDSCLIGKSIDGKEYIYCIYIINGIPSVYKRLTPSWNQSKNIYRSQTASISSTL